MSRATTIAHQFVTPEYIALSGVDREELLDMLPEAIQSFIDTEGREPRTSEELDAYMGSSEEFETYVANHPIS